MSRRKSQERCRSPRSFERLESRELLAVDVTLSPFDHEQTFLGGGAGFTLYSGHLVHGVPAAQRETVYDWLFEDLNLRDLRIFSFRGEANGNDNDDPNVLDLEAMQIPTRDTEFTIYQEALERNPDTKVMAYASSPPPHLSNADGHHDVSKPNFFAEYAEWLYANLAITKQRYGVQIEMIDLLNEPDLQGKVSRADAAQIYANTVPILRQLVADNFDEYGVTMPLVTGTSNLTANGGASWLTDFEQNEPATWSEIDVLTTHLYGPNGFNESAYQSIVELKDADHPLFIQNEMEFGHSSFVDNNGRLPADSLDNDLEGALSLARGTAIALDAGADGFHVFQGVSPQSSGAKSLVFTPWGETAVRRKGFYVYQQMTALQPFESDVVRDVTVGAPEAFHTYAFNQWGDNQVYVNVVNANTTAQDTTLTFVDNAGQPIPFTAVTDYITDATHDMAVNGTQTFATPVASWTTSVAANSVRTFVVDLTQRGYSVPVGDLTYVREATGFNDTPQDGDVNPRTEFLVGYNGNGDLGTGRGVMRGLLEFDLAAAGIPAADAISTVRLEAIAYRGSVGSSESVQFDLHELPGDFNEATATWFDPDGNGSDASGDTTPGGTLGQLLDTTSRFLGGNEDFNADGGAEIFHERVVFESSSAFQNVVEAARDDTVRFAISPNSTGNTSRDFFGFFDDDSEYAPELIVVTQSADVTGPSIVDGVFNYETNERIVLTFDEPINTTTVGSEDFVVRNLTAGTTIDPNSIRLSAVTPTSVEILIRSSVFEDGNWEVSVPGGGILDLNGNGNLEGFTMPFFRLVGDANRDRVVDLADYTIYRETLGSTTDLRANAANTGASAGVIDAGDYTAWAAALGASIPSPVASASSAAIEEAIAETASVETGTPAEAGLLLSPDAASANAIVSIDRAIGAGEGSTASEALLLLFESEEDLSDRGDAEFTGAFDSARPEEDEEEVDDTAFASLDVTAL